MPFLLSVEVVEPSSTQETIVVIGTYKLVLADFNE